MLVPRRFHLQYLVLSIHHPSVSILAFSSQIRHSSIKPRQCTPVPAPVVATIGTGTAATTGTGNTVVGCSLVDPIRLESIWGMINTDFGTDDRDRVLPCRNPQDSPTKFTVSKHHF